MNGKVFWIAIAAALLVSFVIDFANTLDGGAIDLRNRITGVRLLERGIDPYTYKWSYGDPIELCDVYNNPKLPVSKTTATPALLLLHVPFAVLPYRAGEFLWLLAQWMMLLGTGWLWLRAYVTGWQRATLAVFLTGFTYTAAWRLHAERGQAYVLLAFVFAAWLTLTLGRAWGRHWAVGITVGILAALRPPFLLLVPFLALHRRAQLIGVAIGLVVALVGPVAVHPSCWSEYAAGMQTNSGLYRDDVDPRPGPQRFPAMMEGSSTHFLGQFAVIPYADFSAFALLKSTGVEHSWLGDEAWPAWPFLLVVTLAFSLWLVLTRRREPEALLAGLAAWIFLADLFLPAYRDSYNDVLILDVAAAGLAVAAKRKMPWALWPCAAALPAGLLIYLVAPEASALINLPTALLTIGAAMFVCFPLPPNPSKNSGVAC